MKRRSGGAARTVRVRATYDEEAGAHEDGLHLHVQVQRELDAEVVRVGEDLLQKAAPLLADAPDDLFIFPLQLCVNQVERVNQDFHLSG